MPDPLLGQNKNAASYGRIIPTTHARKRMAERNAAARDVKNAIITALKAIQEAEGRVRLEGGLDLDNDPLTIVVLEIQPGLLVITVL